MKTTDPRKSEKKTPPDMDTVKREFPNDQPAEEFIDEKSDWSEDISEFDGKNRHRPSANKK